MSSVRAERTAIVVITLLLSWSWGASAPHVAAAVVFVAFAWWFVGQRGSSQPDGETR